MQQQRCSEMRLRTNNPCLEKCGKCCVCVLKEDPLLACRVCNTFPCLGRGLQNPNTQVFTACAVRQQPLQLDGKMAVIPHGWPLQADNLVCLLGGTAAAGVGGRRA